MFCVFAFFGPNFFCYLILLFFLLANDDLHEFMLNLFLELPHIPGDFEVVEPITHLHDQ